MAMVEDIGGGAKNGFADGVRLPKKFRDDNDNGIADVDVAIEVAVDAEQEFFGAIDIQPRADQLYHPLVAEYRSEPSRLVKCLSVSPQCHQIDDKSVPRTLRPSKSADLNSRVHLDTNDESRVSTFQYVSKSSLFY